MTYDEFKVVVAKVIEIEYDHWLKHGTPIRKEDAVLVADDVAGEVFIDSAVELARLRAEIDRLRGLLREALDIPYMNGEDLIHLCSLIHAALTGAADQPPAECLHDEMTSPWKTATMSGHLCHKCEKNFDVKMHGTADNAAAAKP